MDFVADSFSLKCLSCSRFDPFVFQCEHGFVTVETCFMRGGCVVISIRRVVIAQPWDPPFHKRICSFKNFKKLLNRGVTQMTPCTRGFTKRQTQWYY